MGPEFLEYWTLGTNRLKKNKRPNKSFFITRQNKTYKVLIRLLSERISSNFSQIAQLVALMEVSIPEKKAGDTDVVNHGVTGSPKYEKSKVCDGSRFILCPNGNRASIVGSSLIKCRAVSTKRAAP